MQVEYEITRDDLYAFQWRAAVESPRSKRLPFPPPTGTWSPESWRSFAANTDSTSNGKGNSRRFTYRPTCKLPGLKASNTQRRSLALAIRVVRDPPRLQLLSWVVWVFR